MVNIILVTWLKNYEGVFQLATLKNKLAFTTARIETTRRLQLIHNEKQIQRIENN